MGFRALTLARPVFQDVRALEVAKGNFGLPSDGRGIGGGQLGDVGSSKCAVHGGV